MAAINIAYLLSSTGQHTRSTSPPASFVRVKIANFGFSDATMFRMCSRVGSGVCKKGASPLALLWGFTISGPSKEYSTSASLFRVPVLSAININYKAEKHRQRQERGKAGLLKFVM